MLLLFANNKYIYITEGKGCVRYHYWFY